MGGIVSAAAGGLGGPGKAILAKAGGGLGGRLGAMFGAGAAIPWLMPAIIGLAAVQAGLGIFKAVKGRQMEKQALSDRERYINTMGSWAEWQLGNQKKVVSAGLKSMQQVNAPKIGNLSSSSMSKGRGQIESNLSDYANTLQGATSPIREKNFMASKFGLNK